MSAFDIALLVAAGLLGGAGNALLEVGLPPVTANASNAVALTAYYFWKVHAA